VASAGLEARFIWRCLLALAFMPGRSGWTARHQWGMGGQGDAVLGALLLLEYGDRQKEHHAAGSVVEGLEGTPGGGPSALLEYIQAFHDRCWRQSTLHYRSLEAFERPGNQEPV